MVTEKQPEESTSPVENSGLSDSAETSSPVIDNTDPSVNQELEQQGLLPSTESEPQQSGAEQQDTGVQGVQPTVGADPNVVQPSTSVEDSRTYSQEEWRKAQSSYDRQIANLQTQQEQLSQQLQQSQSEATIEAKRRTLQQQYEQQGYMPEQAQALSHQAAEQERQVMQLQMQKQQLEQQQQQYAFNAENTAKVATARQMLMEKGIDPNQKVGKHSAYDVLMSTADPNVMQSVADSISDLALKQKDVQQSFENKVPSTGPSQEMQSNSSSQSAPLNEKTLMERYMAGDSDPKVQAYARKVASGEI